MILLYSNIRWKSKVPCHRARPRQFAMRLPLMNRQPSSSTIPSAPISHLGLSRGSIRQRKVKIRLYCGISSFKRLGYRSLLVAVRRRNEAKNQILESASIGPNKLRNATWRHWEDRCIWNGRNGVIRRAYPKIVQFYTQLVHRSHWKRAWHPDGSFSPTRCLVLHTSGRAISLLIAKRSTTTHIHCTRKKYTA